MKCCGTCKWWYMVDEAENGKGKCHVNQGLWNCEDACDHYIISLTTLYALSVASRVVGELNTSYSILQMRQKVLNVDGAGLSLMLTGMSHYHIAPIP
jgi:hypothetical protein